jgi:hypothetical protein
MRSELQFTENIRVELEHHVHCGRSCPEHLTLSSPDGTVILRTTSAGLAAIVKAIDEAPNRRKAHALKEVNEQLKAAGLSYQDLAPPEDTAPEVPQQAE